MTEYPSIVNGCPNCKNGEDDFLTVGRNDKIRPNYLLPYIVIECPRCHKRFIYDEAGQLWEYTGQLYPLNEAKEGDL